MSISQYYRFVGEKNYTGCQEWRTGETVLSVLIYTGNERREMQMLDTRLL
jgi:hypothetical protein